MRQPYQQAVRQQKSIIEYLERKKSHERKLEDNLVRAFDIQSFSFADQIKEERKKKSCIIL